MSQNMHQKSICSCILQHSFLTFLTSHGVWVADTRCSKTTPWSQPCEPQAPSSLAKPTCMSWVYPQLASTCILAYPATPTTPAALLEGLPLAVLQLLLPVFAHSQLVRPSEQVLWHVHVEHPIAGKGIAFLHLLTPVHCYQLAIEIQ